MTKTERILKSHYGDMLDLNRRFIDSISKPRTIPLPTQEFGVKTKKTPSKKQLKALARGRKILASKRNKLISIK